MSLPPDAARPDPSRIMALSTAFWDAQALLSANRLGVFAALAEAPRSAAELAQLLPADERALTLLLNALASLQLLMLDQGVYRNTPETEAFLVPGSPAYLGNAIRYSDNLYATWGRLDEAVRSGQPQLATEQYTGGSDTLTRDFVYGMHDRALGIGRVLVELVDLSDCQQMLDVGGGPGTYSALLAQRYPQLHSQVLELPGVAEHAGEILTSLGVAERVHLLPGDFNTTPFPTANDAVLISGVLHRELESGCRMLIDKAAASLKPGGQLILSDVFCDPGGAAPTFAAMFGLNMLLTAQDGGVHADADVADWMQQAGFEVETPVHFPAPLPHRVVVGRLRG